MPRQTPQEPSALLHKEPSARLHKEPSALLHKQPSALAPLIEHLQRTTNLPAAQAERIVADVLAYFSETVECFANRRHRELQASGMRNDAIFKQLSEELLAHRFASHPLSARQIRRLIYG